MLEALFLIAEFVSDAQITAYKKERRIKLSEFKKRNNNSFLNRLPTFKSDYIQLYNRAAHVGTIVKRPLDYPFLRTCTYEYHYGVVAGTAVNGDELILDMTSENDMALRSKKAFLAGFDLTVLEIESEAKNLSREIIFERAKTLQYEIYDLLDLNCKDFAEYCVYGLPLIKRSDTINKFKVFLNDMVIDKTKLQLSYIKNQPYQKFLEDKLMKLEGNKNLLLALTRNPA